MDIEPVANVSVSPYLREIAFLVFISLIAILFRDAIMWELRTAVSRIRVRVFGESDYTVEEKELRTAWIAKGIDPVIDQLEDQAWLFTPSDNPLPSKVYHTPEPIEYDESILEDLENHGYEIKSELDEYNSWIEEYLEKRSSLKDQLQTHFYETTTYSGSQAPSRTRITQRKLLRPS